MKLLSSVTLILAIFLFPPASLALISNNAVPGDAAYPIKRTLEDGIYAIASLNPITRAWFSAARSDRRFTEFSTLIAQGKSASDTLDELVAQTQVAAEEVKKVDDPIKKQDLVNQLSESIKKYDQKLEEVSQSVVTPYPVITPVPTASVSPKASLPPTTITPTPTATVKPALTPPPSEIPKPTFTPTPTQAPTPQPAINSQQIDEAKKKLEEIKKKLEEEKKSHQEKGEDKREDRKNERSEKDSKKDKNKEDE